MADSMEHKQLNFIQRPKLSKNMQFGVDAAIYMDKKKDNNNNNNNNNNNTKILSKLFLSNSKKVK